MTVLVPNTRFINNLKVAHGRRPHTKGVVIHTIEGSDESARNWFNDRLARGIGAHLIIGQEPGHSIQTTDLDNLCYHAKSVGNANYVGIEHEGYTRTRRLTWLNKTNRRLLRSSANRTAWICWHYNLGKPVRGKNVIGHVDVPGNDHEDPGKGWPWAFYMYLCRNAYVKVVKSHGKSWV